MDVKKQYKRNDGEWLTPEEFGERIPGGLGSAAVRKWAREGKIPGSLQLPNGRWQLPAEAIVSITSRSKK